MNLSIENLKIFKLAEILKNGKVAGLKSQLKAAPPFRESSFSRENLANCRNASVLILLFPSKDDVNEIEGVLIERSEYDGVHSKQIGFPGGERDSNDVGDIETAIRECKEELGVKVDIENVLGPLTPLYIPPSNFLVKPYVAWLSERPLFSIDPKEVNSFILFQVSDLNEESNWRNYNVNGVVVPGIKFGKHLVWGATAMMLREFIDTFAK
ncbi:MAG: CoA pyrophosphatase [Flavobacteriales bacterium]|nr:CoA pyrophosphatase [Flavobacteriales bacterium]MBT6174554.1 CoA pyrophosphatase [Flavobacteriales bacterium]